MKVLDITGIESGRDACRLERKRRPIDCRQNGPVQPDTLTVLNEAYRGFSQPLKANAGAVPRLDQGRLLPNACQFIIRLSPVTIRSHLPKMPLIPSMVDFRLVKDGS